MRTGVVNDPSKCLGDVAVADVSADISDLLIRRMIWLRKALSVPDTVRLLNNLMIPITIIENKIWYINYLYIYATNFKTNNLLN